MAKLSEIKPNENKKILVIGQSGSGKTCFASTFPGPTYFADFDGKVTSAASYLERFDPTKLGEVDYDNFAADRTDQGHYKRFYDKLTEHEKLSKEGKLPFKTWVLDSLTRWSEDLMQAILKQNPAIKPLAQGVPAMGHYNIHSNWFKEQLGRILALNCNVIVTAHIERKQDESSGEILNKALVSGKLADYLPIVFEEVYRTYAETKEGKTIYLAQTKSDSKFACRSQIMDIPNPMVLHFNSMVRINNK